MMLCKTMDKRELIAYASVAKGKYLVQEKLDGDRILLTFKDSSLKLTNRRGVSVTYKYPELKDFSFPQDVTLDGEMCVLDQNGLSQFNEGIAFRTHCESAESILSAMQKYPVTFIVFDVLSLNGQDLTNLPLWHRIDRLKTIFCSISNPHIKMIETSDDLMTTWTDVTKRGGEGVIIKGKDSEYEWGKRSNSWFKVKDIKEVDLEFTKYETHPKGITLENTDGIRVVCNGFQAEEVKRELNSNGKVEVTIRHLGQTATGKFRQPVFAKLVVK